ncbi:MAG TPA: OmpA family protein [Saprospiraceae bacterium]|nr:OmpA family protein [Saprospiraceae bacterium]
MSFISFSFSQKPPQINLVPNHGFEEFSDTPGSWYYSGNDFSRVALYWTSPTAASPDLYAPKVQIPKSWKAIGFGAVKSFEGSAHAGITVYGCDHGKPHCKEYVQVQLAEPLVTGQRYGFSCMVAHMQKSVFVRNIELAFSEHEIDEATHDPILLTPTLVLDRWLPSDGKWYRWTGHFVADKPLSYLLIGNFNTDDKSQVKMPWRSELRYGYYYLDDVRLFKIPPIIKVPPADSTLANYIPKEGGVINLSRIYFEHDRTDFMPQALIQLKQLFEFLNRYPEIKIEIRGHTDNVGSVDYNQNLAERRSAAVVNWLVSKGISRQRLLSKGFGSKEPLNTNDTSIGRSQNRRVEVKVISL